MVYRCAHCLAVLARDESGQPLPCDAHPDGQIDALPVDEAGA